MLRKEQKKILISVDSELKDYLALYSTTSSTTMTAVLEKTIRTSLRRLRTLHPPEKLISKLLPTLYCKWIIAKNKGKDYSKFYQDSALFFRRKGISKESIETILIQFQEYEKKINKNTSQSGQTKRPKT